MFTKGLKKGKPPDGWDRKRWAKHVDNLKRAERMTGIAVVSPDGWETVAVILMDHIEKLANSKSRSRGC